MRTRSPRRLRHLHGGGMLHADWCTTVVHARGGGEGGTEREGGSKARVKGSSGTAGRATRAPRTSSAHGVRHELASRRPTVMGGAGRQQGERTESIDDLLETHRRCSPCCRHATPTPTVGHECCLHAYASPASVGPMGVGVRAQDAVALKLAVRTSGGSSPAAPAAAGCTLRCGQDCRLALCGLKA